MTEDYRDYWRRRREMAMRRWDRSGRWQFRPPGGFGFPWQGSAQVGPTFPGATATGQAAIVPMAGRLPYPDDMITAGGGFPSLGAAGPVGAAMAGAAAGHLPDVQLGAPPGYPPGYGPYLPVTTRTTRTPPPGTSGPTVPVYPWGTAPASGPGTTPPLPPGATDTPGPPGSGWPAPPATAPTSGGRTTQGQAAPRPPTDQGAGPAPPGLSQQWWDAFAAEHEGQNPLEFYGAQGEGLSEALADLEWSQGFAEMYGRPPTDDDWRAHWMATRGGPTPEQIEFWREQRRKFKEKVADAERERPPLYVPPQVIWR